MLSTTKGKKTKKHSNNRTRKGFRSRKGKVSRKKSKTGPRKRKTRKRPRTFHKGGSETTAASGVVTNPAFSAKQAVATPVAATQGATTPAAPTTSGTRWQELREAVPHLTDEQTIAKVAKEMKRLEEQEEPPNPFLQTADIDYLAQGRSSFSEFMEREGFNIKRPAPNQIIFELNLYKKGEGEEEEGKVGICSNLNSVINDSELKILASMSSIKQDTGKGHYGPDDSAGSFLKFISITNPGSFMSLKQINNKQINNFGENPKVDKKNVFDIIYLSKGSSDGPGTVIRILKTNGSHAVHPGYSEDSPKTTYSIISIWQASNIDPGAIKDVPKLKQQIAEEGQGYDKLKIIISLDQIR